MAIDSALLTRKESCFFHSPPICQFSHLKPRDVIGASFVAACTTVTGLSIFFSTSTQPLIWFVAQIGLALAMLQWFVLLHEAGHKTLFRTTWMNKLAGHLASLLAGIPFECWKTIHGMHHRWTGWQDLDATTATLVPRPLAWWEKWAVNVCWRCWIPIFSVLYRVQNYWNLPRLYRLFPKPRQRRVLTWNAFALLGVYTAVAYILGYAWLLQIFGLATLVTLMMQDVLILSQHTHVPMELSHGESVKPFTPSQQQFFTRSLEFPKWFSNYVLLNLDAHELHHMYTAVPGYYLQQIDYDTHNRVVWWRWLLRARRVPGEVFLFQNRNQSGFDI